MSHPKNSKIFARGLALGTLLAGFMLAGPVGFAQGSTQDDGKPPKVVTARLAMPIHPVAAEHVERALALAAEIDAVAVVIELDTPGGSLPATRRLVQAILGSEVPVVVWVGPGGAQAASAGFFLLLAADVATMAPGTNTGAAHPVAGSGQDIEGDMGEKVEQDTLALVRSLAHRRDRDLDLAQSAVLESRSFTAEEALENGLVDVVAPSIEALLERIDGRELVDPDAEPGVEPVRLATAGAEIERREMPLSQRLLAALAHPQVAGILMALGMLGLYVEISNPGLLLPGTFGAIALVLGFFGLSVLPVNYAGAALLVLALGLFVAETQVPTFGVLTAGGTVALVLGLSMLFEDLGPAFSVHPAFPWVLGLLSAAFAGFTSWQTIRSRRHRPTTGQDGMVGERGTTRIAFDRIAFDRIENEAPGEDESVDEAYAGKVFVHGELWRAVAAEPLAVGDAVVVEAVDGLRLRVRPADSDPAPGVPASDTSDSSSTDRSH